MNSVQKYIFKLCLQTFFVSFNFFTFLMIVYQLQMYVEMVIEKNIPVWAVSKLILFMVPMISSNTLPIGVLFTVVLVFSQLSTHAEVIAMRAIGFSQFDIVKPVIIFGIFSTILTFVFTNFVMNETNLKYKKLYTEINQSNPTLNIKERSFTNIPGSGQRMSTLKINDVDQQMESVIIFNVSGPNVSMVIAEKGIWTNPIKNQNNLLLKSGNILSLDKNNINELQNITFNNAEYYIKTEEAVTRNLVRTLLEKNVFQINTEIKEKKSKNESIPDDYYLYFHKLISLPLSCLIFVLLGVTLGTTFQRAGKGESYGLAVFVIFIFYSCLQGGEVMVSKGYLGPQMGAWLPNIALLFMSVVIYITKKV